MDIKELIAQKLEWLRIAHDNDIVQNVSTVCRTLGHKIDNNRGILYYQLKIENTIFNATWSVCGFNPGIGDFDKKVAAWVTINDHCVCRLAYINNKPEFPLSLEGLSLEGLNIESDKFIFIPGEWVDIVFAKYRIAVEIINRDKNEEEARRVAKLAAQMLIEPHIEV